VSETVSSHETASRDEGVSETVSRDETESETVSRDERVSQGETVS